MYTRRKITVVGAGEVGLAAALLIAQDDYASIVLVDVDAERAEAAALDLAEAAPLLGSEPTVTGGGDYGQTSGSDVVVIAVGKRPGEVRSRRDLLKHNRQAVTDVCLEVMERCPEAVVLVVTEPLEQICEVVAQITQFPRARLVGVSGLLDSARLRALVALELGVSARDVDGLVVGGRGELVVPVLATITVAGVPAAGLVNRDRLDAIIHRVRQRATADEPDSVRLTPAAAVSQMVDAICRDRGTVVPAHALLLGEYGVEGLFMCVPVRLGAEGIREILDANLSLVEHADFERAAAAARRSVDELAKA
jgi:malate dehydrogenase